MKTTFNNTFNNEKGVIMVVVLMILVIVTLLGLSASRTAVTEIQMSSNERQLVEDFCKAEGGLINTLETPETWLTDDFLTADPTAASNTGAINFDGDANVDATVEVRCIEETGTAVADLSNAANDLPVSRHITPPPVGSGYSLKYFEVRRYGVTATSSTGNTQVQTGVWKVFNKFNI
jgi:Tfp pilus assembly protein PilX